MGLSPLQPDLAAIAAGRLVLQEIDRLAEARADFGFETTLSGMTSAKRLQRWKQAGYPVEIVYLRLRSTQLALRRIAARVRQGGIVCREQTWSGGSNGAGRTLKVSTVRWRIPGRCPRIRIAARGYWNEVHENENIIQEA